MPFKQCLIPQIYKMFKIQQKLSRIISFLENDAKDIIGIEAVNHFKESFDNEGFTDTNLEKWEQVKRREPGAWNGFQYGGTARRPGVQHRATTKVTNYSPAAAERKILTGTTMELAESISYKKSPLWFIRK